MIRTTYSSSFFLIFVVLWSAANGSSSAGKGTPCCNQLRKGKEGWYNMALFKTRNKTTCQRTEDGNYIIHIGCGNQVACDKTRMSCNFKWTGDSVQVEYDLPEMNFKYKKGSYRDISKWIPTKEGLTVTGRVADDTFLVITVVCQCFTGDYSVGLTKHNIVMDPKSNQTCLPPPGPIEPLKPVMYVLGKKPAVLHCCTKAPSRSSLEYASKFGKGVNSNPQFLGSSGHESKTYISKFVYLTTDGQSNVCVHTNLSLEANGIESTKTALHAVCRSISDGDDSVTSSSLVWYLPDLSLNGSKLEEISKTGDESQKVILRGPAILNSAVFREVGLTVERYWMLNGRRVLHGTDQKNQTVDMGGSSPELILSKGRLFNISMVIAIKTQDKKMIEERRFDIPYDLITRVNLDYLWFLLILPIAIILACWRWKMINVNHSPKTICPIRMADVTAMERAMEPRTHEYRYRTDTDIQMPDSPYSA